MTPSWTSPGRLFAMHGRGVLFLIVAVLCPLLYCRLAPVLDSSVFCAAHSKRVDTPVQLQHRSIHSLSGPVASRHLVTANAVSGRHRSHVTANAMSGPEPVGKPSSSGMAAMSKVLLLLHPDDGAPGFMEKAVEGGLLAAEDATWTAAAAQLVKRVAWDVSDDEGISVQSMGLTAFCEQATMSPVAYGMVLGVDLSWSLPAACEPALRDALDAAGAVTFITSSSKRTVDPLWRGFTQLQGMSYEDFADDAPFGQIRRLVDGSGAAAKLQGDMEDLWHRCTAEEAVYAMLVLIDAVMQPLAFLRLQNPTPTFDSLTRAIGGCQDEFRACFTSARCLQSLQCLSQCGMADQSCSYRCIVSYQTTEFAEFSLCALQKNNLLNSQVTRPPLPKAELMSTFRGKPLTAEVAEDILVGHYNPNSGKNFSWLVAAGSNPAYEQFALQHQLWYRGNSAKAFWYHPTFLVEALDGRKVWRTRDYRVRRAGDSPGLWDFSVLDNGITSEERWHLLGAADDLEWLVLFYIGVARKAGLAYRGCLILTPDGSLPPSGPVREAVMQAVARAGLQPWELEKVSNPPIDPSNPPPLIAPDTQPPAPLLQVVAA
mmetsp:Transcript_41250/g.94916  ORF Transcript_41250/g.94916 Transcript_41250/m.94916 type:complete len:598 (-) Transcript_41250:59-1852(-)